MYMQMDGMGWDGMGWECGGAERDGGSAKQDRRPAGSSAGSEAGMCVHSHNLGQSRLSPFAILIPPPTLAPSKLPKEFGQRIYLEAWLLEAVGFSRHCNCGGSGASDRG